MKRLISFHKLSKTTSMNEEKNYGVWTKYFSFGYSDAVYDALRLTADQASSKFMNDIKCGNIKIDDDRLTPLSNHPELDKWVGENDAMLTELARDLQWHVSSVSHFSLPAHDKRQTEFKDASEALRFYQMEKPQGYKATFVIPMQNHDIGRFWEARLYDPDRNPPQNWIPHAQLSFLMFKEVLDQPKYAEMPQELKNHFLYAVLAHSGDNGTSYMLSAVQTCDRMQLIGAEGFYRMFSYGVCLLNGYIGYPTDSSLKHELPNMDDIQSLTLMQEYFSRNMRANIGTEHTEWQHRIAVENVVLLKSLCEENPEMESRIFAPELGIESTFGKYKRKIDDSVWQEAGEIYAQLKGQFEGICSPFEVTAAAIKAIEDPLGAAKLSPAMKESMRRAVSDMPEVGRKALYQTICLANLLRADQDVIDCGICRALENDPRGYVRVIARGVREYANAIPEASKTARFDRGYALQLPFAPLAMS